MNGSSNQEGGKEGRMVDPLSMGKLLRVSPMPILNGAREPLESVRDALPAMTDTGSLDL